VLDDHVIRRKLEIVVGTKAPVVVLAFGGRINPGALIPAERTFLVVAGNDVLAEFRPYRFKEIAEVTDDGKIAEHGVLPLDEVVDDYRHDNEHNGG
jgi:hypothetical protein